MRCPACRLTAVREGPERIAQGYRRFRWLACMKQFNERSGGLLEMFQIHGFAFSYEAYHSIRRTALLGILEAA